MIFTVKGLHVPSYLDKIYIEYNQWLDLDSGPGQALLLDLTAIGMLNWRLIGRPYGSLFLTFNNSHVSQNLHRVADLLAEHFPLSTIYLSDTH